MDKGNNDGFAAFKKSWDAIEHLIINEPNPNTLNNESIEIIIINVNTICMVLDSLSNYPDSNSDPYFDYLLSHDCLHLFFVWSLTSGQYFDILKICQLKIYQVLLAHYHQKILIHKPILRPLLKLIKCCVHLYGGCSSRDVERRLLFVLNEISGIFHREKGLFDFYLAITSDSYKYLFVNTLISFVQREDEIGQLAKNSLLFYTCLSSIHEELTKFIRDKSNFSEVAAATLACYYSNLPRTLCWPPNHPHCINKEAMLRIPGLLDTINFLQYLDVVVQKIHPTLREQLTNIIFQGFLKPVLGQCLLQNVKSDLNEIVTATAYLEIFLRHIHHPSMVKLFVMQFLLVPVSTFISNNHSPNKNLNNTDLNVLTNLKFLPSPYLQSLQSTLLDILISRLDTSLGGEQLTLVTLCLLHTLLDLNCEDLMFNLCFRYLIGCNHLLSPPQELDNFGKEVVGRGFNDFRLAANNILNLHISLDKVTKSHDLLSDNDSGTEFNNAFNQVTISSSHTEETALSDTNDIVSSSLYAYLLDARRSVFTCRLACRPRDQNRTSTFNIRSNPISTHSSISINSKNSFVTSSTTSKRSKKKSRKNRCWHFKYDSSSPRICGEDDAGKQKLIINDAFRPLTLTEIILNSGSDVAMSSLNSHTHPNAKNHNDYAIISSDSSSHSLRDSLINNIDPNVSQNFVHDHSSEPDSRNPIHSSHVPYQINKLSSSFSTKTAFNLDGFERKVQNLLSSNENDGDVLTPPYAQVSLGGNLDKYLEDKLQHQRALNEDVTSKLQNLNHRSNIKNSTRVRKYSRTSTFSESHNAPNSGNTPSVSSKPYSYESLPRNFNKNQECNIGPFLTTLFNMLERMLHNSMFLNLHLTALISRLSCYPSPILHALLLYSPNEERIRIRPGVKNLYQVLKHVKERIETYSKSPEFQKSLNYLNFNLPSQSSIDHQKELNIDFNQKGNIFYTAQNVNPTRNALSENMDEYNLDALILMARTYLAMRERIFSVKLALYRYGAPIDPNRLHSSPLKSDDFKNVIDIPTPTQNSASNKSKGKSKFFSRHLNSGIGDATGTTKSNLKPKLRGYNDKTSGKPDGSVSLNSKVEDASLVVCSSPEQMNRYEQQLKDLDMLPESIFSAPEYSSLVLPHHQSNIHYEQHLKYRETFPSSSIHPNLFQNFQNKDEYDDRAKLFMSFLAKNTAYSALIFNEFLKEVAAIVLEHGLSI